MPQTPRPSFGIMTAPMQIGYHDILRVWREADEIAEIEHAWLFDHLMPIGGDPDGSGYEGWTLLSALAAQTRRLRLGLLVTSNRIRPPAMLAKIATTVDIVSGGRLDFGIGAGSRPDQPLARREYEAHGLPFHDAAHAVGSLAEACTVIRRLWTEPEPFDFHGTYRISEDKARIAIEHGPLPPVRFHDLRHGSATLSLLGKVDMKVISETLGHARSCFTSDTYTSVLPEVALAAAEAVASVVPRRHIQAAGQ